MINAQFNLYSTHFVSENDFYYDCLHYKVMDDITSYDRMEGFQKPYQIIEYCIRPFENDDKTIEGMIKGNIVANFTFEQLSELNISVKILLSWSAPVDLVEQYQIYIDKLNSSLKSEMFYQCEPPWFGVFCQYTFHLDDTFNNIVKKTFEAKQYVRRATEYIFEYIFLNITNLTCYVHLECNRGPAPICLDWREICNGQIDCIGSGVDEMNCFELETNECESNEYQCHNGMCVPEEFFNDGLFDSECLDSTDENYNREDSGHINGFVGCYLDPAFRCEDAVHPHHDLDFTCDDGQQNVLEPFAPFTLPHIKDTVRIGCRNGRDMMLRQLLLLGAEQTNLTYECWVFMSCITYAERSSMCRNICDGICRQPIHSKCNVSTIYVIFPLISISPSHVQSGYWTRSGWYWIDSVIREPDFYCYDVQLCPFFSPTFKIDNRTCVNRTDIILDGFNHQVRLFDRCLTVDKSGNETDCFHPSLFHCPGTSKCISKRRLLDGYVDCYGGADETYVDSCQLNDKHRFRCTSEDKCISNILVRDGIKHCSKGEDEIYTHNITLYYQNLCNGYTHIAPILIDGQNETDETNCEQWPCDNQYTRCDDAWTCRNGADEINCDRLSKCYPDHHECISPTNFDVMCLPINRIRDGNMDCLGGFDERQYCQALPLDNYQCWNETKCVEPTCSDVTYCSFENNTAFPNICMANENIPRRLFILTKDAKLRTSSEYPINSFPKYKYFTLNNSNPSSSNPIHSSVILHVSTVVGKNIDFRRAWICNRGIFIYIGTD